MAWDDTKASGNDITSADWNAMVTDQKAISGKSIITCSNATYDFGAGSGTTTTYVFPSGVGTSTSGVTTSNENLVRLYFPTAGTISRFYTYVLSNTTTSCTFTMRKNGADSSVATSYGDDETGLKSDTTDTISISAGDYITIKAVCSAGAGDDLEGINFSFQFESS